MVFATHSGHINIGINGGSHGHFGTSITGGFGNNHVSVHGGISGQNFHHNIYSGGVSVYPSGHSGPVIHIGGSVGHGGNISVSGSIDIPL